MKKVLFFLCGVIYVITCHSQSISVSSFKLLESDLTANTAGTMEQDQNGETAALIKVVTTQTGFTFDGGSLGIVKTKQTPGEVWVYVPRGSKKITIKHPQLGVLRDYYYPIAIEAARTYEMALTTGTVQTIVKQSANSQYLVIKVTPPDAVVELDNEILPTSNGIAQKFVKLGTYEYRVQASNYHTSAGKVVVDDPKNKKIVEINLAPAYGWIELSGNEDSNGAQVFIDNVLVGTIPMKSNNLPSGEHNVKIVKPLYNPYSQIVVVKDNQTTKITPLLNADFSTVTITVDNDADIYVNEEKKGTGSWTGRLSSGTYVLETKKEGHRGTLMNVDITATQATQTIQLPSPTPIYGSLNITSTPSMADVFIDGKMVGQTPLFLPEILSGKHDLLISYSGYNDNKSHIEVIEGENNPIQIFLDDKPRVPIEIVCNVPDADVYVDDKLFGKISDLNSLSVGEHNLRIIAEGYEEQETDVNVIDTQVKTYNKFVITMKGPEVTFLSDRSNTYINIDNKGFDLFNLNFSKELSFGKHLVTVRAKGENEISANVNVEGSKRVMISFDNRKIIEEDIDEELFAEVYSKIEKKQNKEQKKIKKEQEKKKQENWESVRITSNPSDVYGKIEIGDVTEKYGIGGAFPSLVENNRKRCIKRMKKKAAKLGATVILLGTPYEIHPLGTNFMRMPATAYK